MWGFKTPTRYRKLCSLESGFQALMSNFVVLVKNYLIRTEWLAYLKL